MIKESNVAVMQDWFAQNLRQLSEIFQVVRFEWRLSNDPIQGKGAISLSAPLVIASITLWNKGDLAVLVLDTRSAAKDPVPLVDRQLEVAEDATLLLKSYFAQIREMANPANDS